MEDVRCPFLRYGLFDRAHFARKPLKRRHYRIRVTAYTREGNASTM